MKKYLLAGPGSRGLSMFAKPLLHDFKKTAELAGLFDSSRLRLEGANKILGANLPVYTDFNKALKELDIDSVIVCTKDTTHVDYIKKALHAGKDVISEKPLCISAQQCAQILKASKETGKKVVVTHNVRYQPAMMKIKKIIDGGQLGKILSIAFNEKLDRLHGADYFRRWHKQKKNSGGLLIHKASHCFDVINWFVGSEPDEVFAKGALRLYGKNGKFRSKRCLGCKHKKYCEFYANFSSNKDAKKLYFDAETDGNSYIRDGCVFDPQIDIEDVANVVYNYKNGVQVNFSLLAYSTYEGVEIIIEGTRGRLEYSATDTGDWAPGSITIPGFKKYCGEKFHLYLINEGAKEIKPKKAKGGHGGADPLLREDLFCGKGNSDLATLEEAIDAVLIGDAANISIKTGKKVKIADLKNKM